MKPKHGLEQALARSYRLLEHRMRSSNEVRSSLHTAGFPTPIVEEALRTLTQHGLLDDEAFARQWTASRCEYRPRSKRLIQKELKDKGIDAHLAESVTDELDDDMVAASLAQRRAALMKGLDRITFMRRLSRYLYTRGFSHSTVARALARVQVSRDVS